MFQAVLIHLADVSAGGTSPESPGFKLELLMKRFLCYCVLIQDHFVIHLKYPLLSQPNFLPVLLDLQAITSKCVSRTKVFRQIFFVLIDRKEVIMLLLLVNDSITL